MKKSMMFVSVTFVVMIVMGCTQPTTPEPEPDPVKVYLDDNGETFTRVDTAGTLTYDDIYQWDGEGTMYTGDDVEVEFDATYGTEWTITVGGNVYLNQDKLNTRFYSSDSSIYGDITWLIDSNDVIRAISNYFVDGTPATPSDSDPDFIGFCLSNQPAPSGSTFTYLGEGSFKMDFWNGTTITWTPTDTTP